MAREYYDKSRFSNLIKLINYNPVQAKAGFECYLEDYPMDYYAQCMYASVLIRLQQFEPAEKILESVSKIISKMPFDKIDKTKPNVFYNKVALLCHTCRFEELYEYVYTHIDLTSGIKGIESLIYFCEKKLGILTLTRSESNKYLINQIVEYRESDMIEHVKRHLSDYCVYDDESQSAVFCEDFPFEQVLCEIRKNLLPENKICLGLYDDTYIFKYINCGKKNYKFTDYFRVTFFQNTDQIITMYPEVDCDSLPYVDLSYLNKEKSNLKVISQRDKFNKRYGRD